ncbi:DNA primase [Lachnospiraceae bacterium TWA4]|nr:DNA primase [Lachnospiraceae bacterium TWA4]
MIYPEELIEQIREANDIVTVIGSYITLTKKGSRYFGLCPFHNEKSPSFSVSPDTQLYYCFGCGAGGNVFTFVMEYENYSFQEAVEFLAERVGIALPKNEEKGSKQENDRRKQLLEANKLAATYYYYALKSKEGKRAYDYLKNRGLSDETIKSFGLGYSSVHSDDLYHYLKSKGFSDEILVLAGLVRINEKFTGDLFWNRVMFPIMDVNSRVIGFGGRVMGDGQPKYLNSKETPVFDKSRNLYGLYRAKKSRKSYYLICEGYMDVISLHQAGFTNAVASLGTAFTSGHASLLKRYVSKVILTYDSDNAGINAALRAIPILKEAGIDCKVLSMKPYKDPDEFIKALGAEAFEERIRQAKNSFLFEIEVMRKDYDLNDPAGQTHFQHEIARKLVEFSDPLERENYLNAVCSEFHITASSLKRLVSDMGSQLEIRPRKEVKFKPEVKQTGIDRAQEVLISYLILMPECFEAVATYLEPSDFLNDSYKKAAEYIYEQRGSVSPATLLNHLMNENEDYKQLSKTFQSEIKLTDKKEKERALTDLVKKIKQASLEQAGRKITTVESLQKILKEQAKLSKLYISLR